MAALQPFEYTYDEAGLSAVKYPSGRTISYDFDLAGRVKSVTGNLAAATKTYISGIDYAAHGAIEEMTYGGGTVRKQRYCYNNRLQMSGMVLGQNPASNCASADTTLMRLFMGYGAANNGNLESQDIAADGFLVRQNYTYDKLNRLETAIEATLPTAGSTGWKQTNGYDRWGNRWVSNLAADTYPANLTTQAISASWFTAKNRLNLSGAFDNAGNQTSANGFTLGYDAENRLTTAIHGSNTSKNQTYSYDSDGQRVKQVSGTGVTTLTTYFVYEAMGGLAAEYEVKAGGYPTPAAQCTTCYLAQDHLGSTRALWDDTGVKARFDFLPFGEAIPGDRNGRAALTCAAGVANCYNGPGSLTQKFTGKERDAETGLDYFGARYMSAAQGRFTSPDAPFADQHVGDPQSWNLYAYVRNNPLRYVDPTGNAIELTGDEEERKKALAAIQASLGNSKASANLYINPELDKKGNQTGRFFVGINGDSSVFAKAGDLESGLAEVIGATSIVQIGLGAEITVRQSFMDDLLGNATKNVAKDFGGGITQRSDGTLSGHIQIVVDPNGLRKPDEAPRPTLGEAVAHEFGHALGFIREPGIPANRTNRLAVDNENAARSRGGAARGRRTTHLGGFPK